MANSGIVVINTAYNNINNCQTNTKYATFLVLKVNVSKGIIIQFTVIFTLFALDG